MSYSSQFLTAIIHKLGIKSSKACMFPNYIVQLLNLKSVNKHQEEGQNKLRKEVWSQGSCI